MARQVQLKRSAVQGRVPTTSDLALGEIGINTYDGKIFIKKNDGSDAIVEFRGESNVYVDVHNNTGSTITVGVPVYVSGTHASGKPTVALADNDGSGTYPAIGLAYESIADADEGKVLISGIIEGLDTSSYGAGDALYLDSTAGALTSTRPTSSSTQVQKVGLVTRSNASAGSILVIGAGRTNDVPNEITALTGVSLDAVNLGTFTGTTISDNGTIKEALQELETAVESGGGGGVSSVNTQTGTVVLDADDIDDTSTTHKFATAAQLSAADSALQPGDIGATVQGYDADNVVTDVAPTFTTTVQTTERTITAGAFDLSTGNHWTCGAITVPAPTNATAGTSGLVRITAGPVVWNAVFKFPGGSAPTISSFPAIIPFYVQNSTNILMGNVAEGIS